MSTMKARLNRREQRSRSDPAPVRFTIRTGEDDDKDALRIADDRLYVLHGHVLSSESMSALLVRRARDGSWSYSKRLRKGALGSSAVSARVGFSIVVLS